jgi:hypothetical protein
MGKASAENPWADVFEVKEWKTERDKTGQKGSLTEKVSVTDALSRFNKASDKKAAAPILTKQLELYETVLKSKHSKEKFFSALQKLVQSQIKAVEEGVKFADEHEILPLKKFIDKDGPGAEDARKQAIVLLKDLAQKVAGDIDAGKVGEGRNLLMKAFGMLNMIQQVVENMNILATKEKINGGKLLDSWKKIQDEAKKASDKLKNVDKALGAAEAAKKYGWSGDNTLVPTVNEVLKMVTEIKVP